jgi:hypothetical protein
LPRLVIFFSDIAEDSEYSDDENQGLVKKEEAVSSVAELQLWNTSGPTTKCVWHRQASIAHPVHEQ